MRKTTAADSSGPLVLVLAFVALLSCVYFINREVASFDSDRVLEIVESMDREYEADHVPHTEVPPDSCSHRRRAIIYAEVDWWGGDIDVWAYGGMGLVTDEIEADLVRRVAEAGISPVVLDFWPYDRFIDTSGCLG